MATNVEIKARVADLEALRERVAALADGPAEILDHEDVFFASPSGRLKLRVINGRRGELIHYHRDDLAGPKTSLYTIAPTGSPEAMRSILEAVLGVVGIVAKRRWLYLKGQTRVHLDRVQRLGDFLELEVVLREGQAEAEGVAIAQEILATLGIAPEDLVEGAYLDLDQGPKTSQ